MDTKLTWPSYLKLARFPQAGLFFYLPVVPGVEPGVPVPDAPPKGLAAVAPPKGLAVVPDGLLFTEGLVAPMLLPVVL